MSDRTVMILLACVLAVIVAVLAAAAAGYLARCDHATPQAALSRAALVFAATLTLAANLTTALVALTG
ncbi:hypothetical protein [Wenjunlia tyrosinilytica]|jgi:hypothetical protein|uniref:Uncharacterized protein n=1 Tax=Wenjunlia tyrosinilytica TaxID=1544741 RepID=A0A917ZUD2_9ACTN|nr:hypothetical protein [Wenjunlia tyrosinilytica]GGO94556.1 hypothetical protein GCM10012280_49740 [Wenjunlia tyrosinilytica]